MATDDLGHAPSDGEHSSQTGRRRPRFWWIVIIILLAIAGTAFAWWNNSPGRGSVVKAGPLDGKLRVFIRSPQPGKNSMEISEKGALPARPGGIMNLQVELNQHAFVYVVWLDSQGQMKPLYPWNSNTLETKDVNQPPPLRRSANIVYSPVAGGGWTFSEQDGMETVLLLARSTPLPAGTRVGDLLSPLPPPLPVGHPHEIVSLSAIGNSGKVTTLVAANREDAQAAAEADEPLRAMMLRLSQHFELVQAVRFAHQSE